MKAYVSRDFLLTVGFVEDKPNKFVRYGKEYDKQERRLKRVKKATVYLDRKGYVVGSEGIDKMPDGSLNLYWRR